MHSSKGLHIHLKTQQNNKTTKTTKYDTCTYMHSSKVLHIHIKKQQNNNISYEHAYTFLKGTSHTNKTTKSDTDTHTHSSKVLHIQIKQQNNKITKQQNPKDMKKFLNPYNIYILVN